jgi:hypothetical protein
MRPRLYFVGLLLIHGTGPICAWIGVLVLVEVVDFSVSCEFGVSSVLAGHLCL